MRPPPRDETRGAHEGDKQLHEHHAKPQATDPVCGMRVSHDSAVVVEHRGVTYRFCDPACAETFRDEPERWVGAGDKPGFTHSHSH
jgi:YHS domain-containing protein